MTQGNAQKTRLRVLSVLLKSLLSEYFLRGIFPYHLLCRTVFVNSVQLSRAVRMEALPRRERSDWYGV